MTQLLTLQQGRQAAATQWQRYSHSGNHAAASHHRDTAERGSDPACLSATVRRSETISAWPIRTQPNYENS